MDQNSLIKEIAGSLFAGPVEFLLDRGVRQSTTAAAMCRRLEGRTLQLDSGSQSMAAYFEVTDGQLQLLPGIVAEPDATLTGSPVSLARLAAADPQQVIREGAVKVSGDSDIAEQFQCLFSMLQPDWEEELSKFTGDVIAHEVGNAGRGLAGWSRQARRSFGRSVAEYLSEESEALATAAEIDEFCAGVDDLAAAADRLEARLQLLRTSESTEQPEQEE